MTALSIRHAQTFLSNQSLPWALNWRYPGLWSCSELSMESSIVRVQALSAQMYVTTSGISERVTQGQRVANRCYRGRMHPPSCE
jgi:hypothetical protein